MPKRKLPNQTKQKDPNDRGQKLDKKLFSAICSVWLGIRDDYQTLAELTDTENQSSTAIIRRELQGEVKSDVDEDL